LSKLPLVMREAGSKTRQKLDAAAIDKGVLLRPTIEAEGREAVEEIVRAGSGIGFVSSKEFSEKNNLVSIQIEDAPIDMEEAVISLKERSGGKLIKTFMAMVENSSL